MAGAAFEPGITGARGNGAGMTSVILEGDVFSTTVNPALLGTGISLRAGSTHTRLFGLKELSRTAAGFCLPVRFGSLGVNGTVFGNPLYQETVLRLGLGFPVVPGRFFLGFTLSSGQIHIENGPSLSARWIDGGLFYILSETVCAGFAFSNSTNSRLNSREPLPQVTRLGFGIQPAGGVLFLIAMDKDVRFPLEFKSGVEISPAAFLTLRCGMTGAPERITAGFSIGRGVWSFDYAMVRHPVLGSTHHASLRFARVPVPRNASIPAAP